MLPVIFVGQEPPPYQPNAMVISFSSVIMWKAVRFTQVYPG